jgi:hypothetical protein
MDLHLGNLLIKKSIANDIDSYKHYKLFNNDYYYKKELYEIIIIDFGRSVIFESDDMNFIYNNMIKQGIRFFGKEYEKQIPKIKNAFFKIDAIHIKRVLSAFDVYRIFDNIMYYLQNAFSPNDRPDYLYIIDDVLSYAKETFIYGLLEPTTSKNKFTIDVINKFFKEFTNKSKDKDVKYLPTFNPTY